jgi:hypothetical protein
LTTIGDRAFYYCESLKEIEIPGSVTSVGEYLFYGGSLEKVTFREGLKKIDDSAFRACDKLREVNLPSTLEEIEDRAFYYTEDLESITLPASLKKMGEYIFYESGLTTVTFADGATIVPAGAFRSADNLETVNLPDTIEKIGNRAFYYCDIESIVLPKGLKEIGDHAFYECDLEKVYYRGSEAEWGAIDIGDDYAIQDASIVCNYQDDNIVETGGELR